MSYRWSEEEEHLLKLLLPTNSHEEIEIEFKKRLDKGIRGFRNDRSLDAIRRKCLRDNLVPEDVYTEELNPYQQRLREIQEIQKGFQAKSVLRDTGLIALEDITTKILCFSDLHIPFARMDIIEKACELHSDADICVLNGDIFENDAWSSFEGNKRINALIEYNLTFQLVKILSERFKQVVITNGNHDARISRTFSREGAGLQKTQILRADLLARIANGEELDAVGMLKRKHTFENVYYDPRESWYIKIGKTIFAHPWSKGSSKPGFTVERVNDYFLSRYDENEYDSIVIGHTHKVYKGIVNSKLLIEQGCIAGLMAYAHSPKLDFIRSDPMNGFAVIYQDKDGNTDFNLSGPVFAGHAIPPKKAMIMLE